MEQSQTEGDSVNCQCSIAYLFFITGTELLDLGNPIQDILRPSSKDPSNERHNEEYNCVSNSSSNLGHRYYSPTTIAGSSAKTRRRITGNTSQATTHDILF
jgi:hypothetical protein